MGTHFTTVHYAEFIQMPEENREIKVILQFQFWQQIHPVSQTQRLRRNSDNICLITNQRRLSAIDMAGLVMFM